MKFEKGCRCSLTNSCDSVFNDNNVCNCDDRENNVDVGILSSRDQLPVTQLAYGASNHRYSFIRYTLGDLICYGKRGLYPSEAGDADFLFKASYTGGLVINERKISLSSSFFREYLISGSKATMMFENILFGNELESWTGSSFVAPVGGIYAFNLHIVTNYYSRTYRLLALINNGDDGVDWLIENSNQYKSYNDVGHHHSFQIERELKVGDTLTIYDQYTYNNIMDYSYNKCRTNDEEHSCSYITGRLIKRL